MLCLIFFSFIATPNYSNLLYDEKGEYSLFFMWNDHRKEEVPLKGWPEEFNNKSITKIHGSNEDLEAINKKYPELDIEKKLFLFSLMMRILS